MKLKPVWFLQSGWMYWLLLAIDYIFVVWCPILLIHHKFTQNSAGHFLGRVLILSNHGNLSLQNIFYFIFFQSGIMEVSDEDHFETSVGCLHETLYPQVS